MNCIPMQQEQQQEQQQQQQQSVEPSSAREPDPDTIKMFVGQIPRSWGEAECKELFQEFGSVYQLNVLRDKATQTSRGCCFVTYYKRADAIAAQAALHNIRTLPQMYHPVQMKPADTENRNERKLFVGMLNKKLNEDDVRAMFAQFGQIEDCTVLRDGDGKSRGCAFVTFAHRSYAQQAIKQMNLSQTMEGCTKPLVVKFADTQREKDAKKNGMTTATNLQNSAALASTLQQLMQVTQMTGGNAAIGNQLATLANLLQTAAQPNVLSLLGNVLTGLGRLSENTSPSSSAHTHLSTPFSFGGQSSLNSTTTSHANAGDHPSAASLQQQQQQQHHQQQYVSLQQQQQHQQQQRLIEMLSQNAPGPGIGGQFDSGIHTDQKHNGVMTTSAANSASNLIQLTGSNQPSNIDAMQQALAGLQHFAGLYPQLAGNGMLSSGTSAAAQAIGSQSKGPEGCNLFIYHLPQDFCDNDLIATFAPFGTILSAKVFIDKQTNLSKCFGFVSYDNATSAQNAISALNGFQIGSKRLKVQLKRGKDSKPYSNVSASTGASLSA